MKDLLYFPLWDAGGETQLSPWKAAYSFALWDSKYSLGVRSLGAVRAYPVSAFQP